jgi:hypothetical protein
LLTEITVQAGTVDPLDTGMITNFNIFDQLAAGNDDTSTFVSTDEGELCGKRPVTVDGVEIGMTDTGVFDVDEDFIWAWLGNIDLTERERAASLVDDLSHLLLWNGRCHVDYGMKMCD